MKTILITLFITQGFGVDGSMQYECPTQQACDHALDNMFKTKDSNRGWHKGTQVVAFCAPEGCAALANSSQGRGSVIERLRENRRNNSN